MDFWGTVLIVTRRWYVALPAFLLSLAAAVGVYSTIPTPYVSNAVLVLTIPPTGGSLPSDPTRPNGLTNPLLNFDQGLSMSASMLIQVIGTPETARALGVVPDGETTFTVTNGGTNPEAMDGGPFVYIEGRSMTPAGARDIVTRVRDRARIELASRQRQLDAPPATYIAMSEMVAPTEPLPQRGGKSRGAAAALLLGVLASLASVFSLESFLDARARRRGSRGPAPSAPGPRAVRPSALRR
ncbi:hypothetical protein [Streptosporangium longisporum]|uniref:Polysaccharide chain length determinant N-terminal domain-containing protein n=1 Tax=Streptosporangium longisporum TaxID=46187 RepID=A0ABP6KAV9_9ACTN